MSTGHFLLNALQEVLSVALAGSLCLLLAKSSQRLMKQIPHGESASGRRQGTCLPRPRDERGRKADES
jgi:hypothetical protein